MLHVQIKNIPLLVEITFFGFALHGYRQQLGSPHLILVSSTPSGIFLNDIKNSQLIPEDVNGCLIAFYQYVNKLPEQARNLLAQITAWLDKQSQTQALTPLLKKLG